MSATLGIAILETAVDLAGLDDGLNSAQAKTESSAGGISGILGSAFTGIATIGLAAGAAAAAAIGAIGLAAFDVAGQVQGATNNIQAELGVTAEKATELGQIAKDVWANNFGADIADAAAAVSEVRRQMGDLADNELQRATENAFRLADVFGVEIGESTNAANALMQQFGLTADQAFDLVTTGMQSGLNTSDDFIDSIGEYSNQFSAAGFSADEMFSIMSTGLQAGVLGTDKISDAIKEMTIKLNEGGDDTRAAFDTIGLSFDQISSYVASGEADWADYFNVIVNSINSIEDPIQRSQAQVAIFGTMAEDLGVSFTEGLSSATASLDMMAGATDSLDAKYNNLGAMMEGFKRQALEALEPIGAILLDLANSVMPLVAAGFEWFKTTLVPIIEGAAVAIKNFIDGIRSGVESGLTPLEAFKEAILNLIPPELIPMVETLIDIIGTVLSNAIDNARLAIDAISDLIGGDFAGAFESLQDIVENVIENVVTIFGELAEMIGPALEDLWATFSDWFGDQDWAQLGTDTATAILEGLSEFINWIGPMLGEWAGAFWDWVQSVDWIGLATTILTAIWDGLNAFGDFAGAILANWLTVFWDWVQSVDWIDLAVNILTAIWDGLNAFGDFAGPILLNWLTVFWDWVQSVDWIGLAVGIITAIIDGLATFAEWVGPILSGWASAFFDWVGSIDWAGIGRSIIDGVVSGISSAGSAIKSALLTAAQAAWDEIVRFWDSRSPSKRMAQLGDWLMVGWADGIRAAADAPASAMTAAAEDVEIALVTQITQAMNNVTAAMALFVNSIKTITGAGVDGSVIPVFEEFKKVVFYVLRGFIVMFWEFYDEIKGTFNTLDRIPFITEAVIDASKAMSAAIVAIADLAKMDNLPADLPGKLLQLTAFIKTAVAQFVEISTILNVEMAEAVILFAEAAKKVLGLVEQGIAAAAALSAVDFGAIVQGWHLRDQIVIFRNIIRTLIREFAEAAMELNAEMAGAVGDFATAADKVIGLVIDGLAAATALSQIDFGPIVNGFQLRDQIVIFRNIIRTLVTQFAEVANDIDQDLSEQIKKFADGAGALLKLIEPGIEGIKNLAGYVATANIGAIATTFAKDLVAALRAMVTAFTESALAAGEALAQASEMAGFMRDLLGVIKPGIEAIKALADYVKASDIEKQAAAFAADLVAVSKILVENLTEAARNIGAEALKWAAAFANDVADLAKTIAGALESINKIANSDLPDISDALAYIRETSELLALTLTKARGELSVGVVGAAAAFAKNVGVMVDDILAALDHLDRLFNANVPGSLQSILDAMIRNLYSRAPQAGVAAAAIAAAVATAFTRISWEAIGLGITEGIVRGINRGADSIANAARIAAEKALAAVKRELGISSPSAVFAAVGREIPEGLALGIRDRSFIAESAIAGLAAGLAGGGANTQNYYNFSMSGAGMSSAQQIDMLIEAALNRRGIRAEYMQRAR